MQDEVLKHTKKIYTAVKHPTHSFRHKLTEIVIEILIIVFAVTLSIWLHSLSEHRHEQAVVKSFLKGLQDDLTSDMEHFRRDSISFNNAKNLVIERRGFTKASIDSAMTANPAYNGNYLLPQIWCNLSEGRYQGFKSSGKIELIENDSLKTAILNYYEQTIPEIHRMEEDFKQTRLQVSDAVVSNDPDTKSVYAIFSRPMKILYYQAEVGLNKIIVNNNWALESSSAIIAEIKKSLK